MNYRHDPIDDISFLAGRLLAELGAGSVPTSISPAFERGFSTISGTVADKMPSQVVLLASSAGYEIQDADTEETIRGMTLDGDPQGWLEAMGYEALGEGLIWARCK